MGIGEGGAEGWSAASLGTRLERTRVGGLRGGSEVKSIAPAVAGRAGGGPAVRGDGGGGPAPNDLPGDAVCARGGGGGGVGFDSVALDCEYIVISLV